MPPIPCSCHPPITTQYQQSCTALICTALSHIPARTKEWGPRLPESVRPRSRRDSRCCSVPPSTYRPEAVCWCHSPRTHLRARTQLTLPVRMQHAYAPALLLEAARAAGIFIPTACPFTISPAHAASHPVLNRLLHHAASNHSPSGAASWSLTCSMWRSTRHV